ncbi:Uncharacterised protein [Vibrio cholerae]|nr:Uncharacterised protein [Vibrio cholerae]
MVIQITWADLNMSSDMVSRDVTFTLLIKQLKCRMHYAILSFHHDSLRLSVWITEV